MTVADDEVRFETTTLEIAGAMLLTKIVDGCVKTVLPNSSWPTA